jgi:hypothetical protein
MEGELELLTEKGKADPGDMEIHYQEGTARHPQWIAEDTGMFVYHVQENETFAESYGTSFLRVGECILARIKQADCDNCRIHGTPNVFP